MKISAKIDQKLLFSPFLQYRPIGQLGRIFGRTLSAIFGRIFGRIFGIGRTLQNVERNIPYFPHQGAKNEEITACH